MAKSGRFFEREAEWDPVRTRYGAKLRVHDGPGSEPDMARQEFKAECDINTIMKKYEKTGLAPTNVNTATYGDFSEVGDYLEAQRVVVTAREQFDALPARVRDRFRNDPRNFLEFVMDKRNIDEARSLGLLKEEVKKDDAAVSSAPPGNGDKSSDAK